ncbi:MAG: DUF4179 domain-containing protein [Lachnospiraceae bacterium]|nr:DUF4179 domain-containing protein [Lachnospiraceae bacterium]
MKNSENDNLTFIDNTEAVLDNPPTAEEADRILAEAEAEIAAAETDAPEYSEFDETAVTELALKMMRAAETDTTADTDAAVAGSATENTGKTVAILRPTVRRRRKVLRVALVAACIAVLLFGTFVAAANVIYDVRFTQLIGVEGTMTELENGYFQIGLSKTIDDLTVTVVDAIGDARVQWVEIRTNRKLADGTPDGWLEQAFTDDGLYINTPALPDEYAATGYLVKYYDGSLLSTVFSDIDCTERYQKHLVNTPTLDMRGSLIPFCRDGYLWYMMETSCEEDINRSFTHLEINFNTSAQDDVMFEFNWCNNYKSDKETFRVNKSVGQSKVKKVVLTGASMFLYTNGGYNDIRLDSVKLEDGTVLHTNQSENEVAPGKSGAYSFMDDGRLGCSGSADDDGIFTSSNVEYSLLPGVTFQTPQSMTSLIPMDKVVAITVNGVEISLR